MPQTLDDTGALAYDKAESAKALANKHYEIESGLTQIFHVTGATEAASNGTEPIKLLEVNENTVTSGIMPLHFGPAPASGVFHPSVIIEVTPEEFKKVQSHELSLPAGWDYWEELPKPASPGAA